MSRVSSFFVDTKRAYIVDHDADEKRVGIVPLHALFVPTDNSLSNICTTKRSIKQSLVTIDRIGQSG